MLRKLPPASVDLVVTDPPYGTTDCEWDQAPPLDYLWRLINRVLKPNGVAAIFAAQPFATDVINANRAAFRYDLVWEKAKAVGFLNANRQPLRAHELILIFCRRYQGSLFRPQFTAGKPYVTRGVGKATEIYRNFHHRPTRSDGRRFPRSVQKWATSNFAKTLHPTQKPVDAARWLIGSYSLPGQTVLDCYLGSGTTGVAAVEAGRRFVGIERDPGYFRIARKRIHDAMNDARAA